MQDDECIARTYQVDNTVAPRTRPYALVDDYGPITYLSRITACHAVDSQRMRPTSPEPKIKSLNTKIRHDKTKHVPKTDFPMPAEGSTCAVCDDSEGKAVIMQWCYVIRVSEYEPLVLLADSATD